MNGLTETAQLALDTLHQKPTKGIPGKFINLMEHAYIERIANVQPGDYKKDPARTYLTFQRAMGVCLLDQYIPENPLTIGSQGFEEREKGATTGAETIVRNGILIDSPEAVVEHLEGIVFPNLQRAAKKFDE
ncbi:MAG: hypothetical protein QGG64_24285, partial [Candidatus Latescibacteria bacterium]|nr:hypothetical protein [Candidatus Latescibacterota bacterium]